MKEIDYSAAALSWSERTRTCYHLVISSVVRAARGSVDGQCLLQAPSGRSEDTGGTVWCEPPPQSHTGVSRKEPPAPPPPPPQQPTSPHQRDQPRPPACLRTRPTPPPPRRPVLAMTAAGPAPCGWRARARARGALAASPPPIPAPPACGSGRRPGSVKIGRPLRRRQPRPRQWLVGCRWLPASSPAPVGPPPSLSLSTPPSPASPLPPPPLPATQSISNVGGQRGGGVG